MVQAMIDGGVTHVYGIPGGYTIKVFEAIRDASGIDAVLAPSEQIAACMADMHGRITRRPAVLSGQGAFIAGTGSFGIMEAYLSGTPMVIVTEMTDHGIAQHNATQSITGDYASVDLPAILRAMTKFTTVATTPNEAVHGVQLALHHATRRPSRSGGGDRPPRGLLRHGRPCEPPELRAPVRVHELVPAPPTAGVIATVASRLRDAKLPVIVAGNGTHHCYEQLDMLARRAAAPVVTTQKARGVLADSHPWAGGMLGGFGSPIAYELLRRGRHGAGAGLTVESGRHDDGVIRDLLGRSPEHRAGRLRRRAPRAGDPRIDGNRVGRARVPRHAAARDRRPRIHRRQPMGKPQSRRASIDDETELAVSSSPMRPQRVVGVLNGLLTDRHRVVLDAGNNRIFHYRYLQMPAPGRLHMCGGHLGMGWGPSAALVAALLRPDDRILSIVGDGGMQMALPTLAFAAAHHLPITFIVMNNGVLGNVLDAQKAGRYAVDLPAIDYAAVAQAFGLLLPPRRQRRGIRRRGPVADRVAGPALIEVMTDPGESSGQPTRSRLPARRRRRARAALRSGELALEPRPRPVCRRRSQD